MNYARLIHAKWNRGANKHRNPFKMTIKYSLPPSTPAPKFPHHFSRPNKIKIWNVQVNCKNLSLAFREFKYFIGIIDARRWERFPRRDFHRERLSSAYVITSFECELITPQEDSAEILSSFSARRYALNDSAADGRATHKQFDLFAFVVPRQGIIMTLKITWRC